MRSGPKIRVWQRWTGSITWWHNSTGNLFGSSVVRTLNPDSTSYSAYYYVSTPL